MPRSPSALGAAIEAAVSTRFARHREPVQYMTYFRTDRGSVFAIERVTKKEIILWLPEQEGAKRVAEHGGIGVTRSLPWNGRKGPKDYGRISSLRSIPELAEEPLLRVAVKSAGEAVLVVEALA